MPVRVSLLPELVNLTVNSVLVMTQKKRPPDETVLPVRENLNDIQIQYDDEV